MVITCELNASCDRVLDLRPAILFIGLAVDRSITNTVGTGQEVTSLAPQRNREPPLVRRLSSCRWNQRGIKQ